MRKLNWKIKGQKSDGFRIVFKPFFVAFVIFFCTGITLNAQQVFTNDYPPTREYFPFFNADYIKENRIKSLHTIVMYKMPSQKIEHSIESDSFSFMVDGVVNAHQLVTGNGDTSLTKFVVNEDGLVSEKTEINKHRNVKISITYNERNDIVSSTETDIKTGVELKKDTFNFVYEYYDQYKKYWLNDEGLSYKYSIFYLDDQKRIIKEQGRSIRGTSKHTIYYKYEGENLTYYSSNIRETTRREKKYEMIYDAENRLVEMNEYKDGAYIHHHEFLYENGLLVAILEKHIRNQRIKIIKLKYEIY